jgi:group I intron endonuclease
MIKANFNENLTTDLILKNTTILDPITFESILLKGGYDYEDCCCGDTCSCGCGHNKIELSDKMITIESGKMNLNIISESSKLDSKELGFILTKGGYDYEDCCCGDSCSCGCGHNKIELSDKSDIFNSISTDSTLVHDLNNVVIDNLILEQPDINIPLIAFRIGVIFLIGMFIEVCNAWETLGIKKKPSGKKDNSITGSKLLDAPVSWGLYFQDAASPSFEGVVDLHNRIMFYLVVILFGVSWVLLSVMANFNYSSNKLVYRHLNHGKYVPIQKCSKLKNPILISKMNISFRFYTTVSGNSLNINEINYVKVYEDAYGSKKNILEENKGKSGIYMLTNKLTNDIYIGHSNDISKRFINYFNPSYIKSKNSFIISRALIKYGYSNFSVTILEYCDRFDLISREQYYLNKLNPHYNILKIAGSSRDFKHSKETKAKISKSLKGVYIKEKSALFGRTHTEETKRRMSLKKAEYNNPMYGKTHSMDTINLMRQKALGRIHYEETKLKMSITRGNPVIIYEKCSSEGFKLIGSFVSARRASKFLGISSTTVLKYMNSGEIFKNRYKFSSK